MKKQLIIILGLGLLFTAARAEVSIKIVQPYENAALPFLTQSFVFGSVSPATASLTINGVSVKPHTNGGFLTMIPFKEGLFSLVAVASDGTAVSTTTRTVTIASAAPVYPADHREIHPLTPRGRVVVRAGDTLEVSFQSAPGGTATARFKSGGDPWPMEEQGGMAAGIYKGVYVIRSEDKWDNSDIVYSLKRRDGKKLMEKAGVQVTVQRRRTPRLVELREDSTLLTGPDTDYGYNLYCLKGTRLEVSGETGDFLRVQVGDQNQGWIRKSAALELPSGSTPARSVSRNIRVNATPDSTVLEIPLQARHPHRVEQFVNPHNLKLTLYGVVADSDRIRYRSVDSVIKEVTWHQSEPQTLVIDIQTKQNQGWGYDARYDGSVFVFEIRHRPKVGAEGAALQGLKVALDAGHSNGSYGTIGPLGHTEAAVVLATARVVKSELERKGAEVVMIQDGTREPSLQNRVDAAWLARANIFISLHADACAEGQDPRELEGYSVHYYHPQSHALAGILHRQYGVKTKIRDQGLWRSNLAVCRPSQMPSLLLEIGFLILPEFEELFITDRHQKKVAEVVTQGLIEFFRSHRS